MRTEPPNAARAAELLSALSMPEVVAIALDHHDTPWLEAALRSGKMPRDCGIFWVPLPCDSQIWPVRVFIASFGGESAAVWLTYRAPLLTSFEVETQANDYVNQAQAGEPGRARLRSRQGEPDPASQASDTAP